jgi:hypothetical protein
MDVAYDVCIVGAGPHALSVLSALQTPAARLSEQQHLRKGRRKGSRPPSVCVIDPSGKVRVIAVQECAGARPRELCAP